MEASGNQYIDLKTRPQRDKERNEDKLRQFINYVNFFQLKLSSYQLALS